MTNLQRQTDVLIIVNVMEEERVVHQGGVKEHLEINLNSVK